MKYSEPEICYRDVSLIITYYRENTVFNNPLSVVVGQCLVFESNQKCSFKSLKSLCLLG